MELPSRHLLATRVVFTIQICASAQENHGDAQNFHSFSPSPDRLCGLVVRVLGYRPGGPGSIRGITKKK
jgi:hypothetical protein